MAVSASLPDFEIREQEYGISVISSIRFRSPFETVAINCAGARGSGTRRHARPSRNTTQEYKEEETHRSANGTT